MCRRRKTLTGKLLLLAFSCGFSSMLYAAGFDCRKASTPAEKLVCNSTQLSEFDSWLNRAFRMRIWHASKQDISKAKEEQRNWLISVRDKCFDEMCMSHAYITRLKEVNSISTPQSEGEYVGVTEEFSGQEADFLRSLDHRGIPVSACPLMVKYIDKSYTTGRDSSYGAFCLTKNDAIIMICDDTMIGKLTIRTSGFEVRAGTLLDFTKENCPPGG